MKRRNSMRVMCIWLVGLLLWGCGDILVDGDEGMGSEDRSDSGSETNSEVLSSGGSDETTGTDTDTFVDSGTGSAPSPGPECVIADDCLVMNDCCGCGAYPTDLIWSSCGQSCDTPQCDADGIPADHALCVNGYCVLDVNCDASEVTCKMAVPKCLDGAVPVVNDAGNCWTGPCVPETECRNEPKPLWPTVTDTETETDTGTAERENQTLFVNSARVPCEGVGPMQCLEVREDETDEWSLFYDTIAGFDYEAGYVYELVVEVTEIDNPPADGSSLEYKLVEIVSKTVSGCEHGGEIFAVGATFDVDDCNFCFNYCMCSPGGVWSCTDCACSETCDLGDSFVSLGESYLTDDNCTKCTCGNSGGSVVGQWQCEPVAGCDSCYSPAQNLSAAYDEGAIGCACDPAIDEAVCINGVALMCINNQWAAVEDGPCMPSANLGTECATANDCRVESNCCECLALPKDEDHAVCDMACDANKCETDGIPAEQAVCVNGYCVLDVNCDASQVSCFVAEPQCGAGTVPTVNESGTCWLGGGCVLEEDCRNN